MFIRYLFALIYDALITFTVFMVATAVLFMVFPYQEVNQHPFMLWSYLLAINFIWVAYCWKTSGQTIGAKCWKLRVVLNNGDPLSTQNALIRYLWAIVCVPTGLALISIIFTQPIHSYLSRTKMEYLGKAS